MTTKQPQQLPQSHGRHRGDARRNAHELLQTDLGDRVEEEEEVEETVEHKHEWSLVPVARPSRPARPARPSKSLERLKRATSTSPFVQIGNVVELNFSKVQQSVRRLQDDLDASRRRFFYRISDVERRYVEEQQHQFFADVISSRGTASGSLHVTDGREANFGMSVFLHGNGYVVSIGMHLLTVAMLLLTRWRYYS